jgi:hypothetical protein
LLRKVGFDLTEGWGEISPPVVETADRVVGESLTTLSDNTPLFEEDYLGSSEVSPTSEDLSPLLREGGALPAKPKSRLVRVKYEDPWKIHASMVLQQSLGQPLPTVVSWNGDGIRLQDKLRPDLFGPYGPTELKNPLHLWEVKDHNLKAWFISHHTHWGAALWSYARDKESEFHSFAVNLKRRVLRLISGGHDPLWPSGFRERLWASQEARDPKKRVLRLIELLKTVDGMFLQRYLVFPEEVWNWEKYDLFILQGISLLIGDEFLDGELTAEAMKLTTVFSTLKKLRKSFKMHANRMSLGEFARELDQQSKHWAKAFFSQLYRRVAKQEGTLYAFNVGLLSQTRGAGRPPPLVTLQSKRDFIITTSTAPPPMSKTSETLVMSALDKILDDLPQDAFTGLSTKARVTVATSASWESTRKQGGTAEAIRETLTQYSEDNPVPVRSLETGKIERYVAPSAFETIGELIFWVSLDVVLKTPLDMLRHIFVTVVLEPGKARTVTKGLACLKIVLDVVNKICSWPLKKGVESSASGMGKSNHAWNFFIRMMSDEMKEDLFSVQSRQEEEFEGYVERTDTYEDFFVSSTDYKEATDGMTHDFAKIAGNRWMTKCGIPPILRGIVNATCYGPRTVVFTATGGLSGYGKESDLGENLRSVSAVRGIPMGDPLTKVVLHLSNMVARSIGEGMFDASFYRRFENQAEAFEAFHAELFRRGKPKSNN